MDITKQNLAVASEVLTNFFFLMVDILMAYLVFTEEAVMPGL
jgi:hypothetical protein